MLFGVPRTSAERKTELLKFRVDKRGQACQFVSSEKKMPRET